MKTLLLLVVLVGADEIYEWGSDRMPQPAQRWQLRDGSGYADPVEVAADRLAYRQLWKAIGALDQQGITELKKAGQVVEVPHGTACLVLETEAADATSCEVRMLDGPYQGRKGIVWVGNMARKVRR